MLLVAWGDDFIIKRTFSTHPSYNFYQSYDIAAPNPGLIFHVTRFASPDDSTTSQKLYFSNDSGKTWHPSYDFHAPSNLKQAGVKLLYYSGYIVEYFPIEKLKIARAIVIDTSLTGYNMYDLDLSGVLDTIINTKFQAVDRYGTWEFYVAAMGKKGDTTLLSLWKNDENWGTYSEILHRACTTDSALSLFLLDFDVYAQSPDSVLFIPTALWALKIPSRSLHLLHTGYKYVLLWDSLHCVLQGGFFIPFLVGFYYGFLLFWCKILIRDFYIHRELLLF